MVKTSEDVLRLDQREAARTKIGPENAKAAREAKHFEIFWRLYNNRRVARFVRATSLVKVTRFSRNGT